MISTENIPKKTSLPQRIFFILFGLFLTIVILEIGLRIGGFAILSIQEYRNLKSIKQKGTCRIMCLGESTTQGQYPPYLEDILNQRNIGIKFSVIDKGLAGTRTAAILSDLEVNLDKYQPDIVVTMMGINDEGRHIPYEVASKSKIILIIHSFKAYKLARLFWLHAVTKFKEKGIYISKSNDQSVKRLPKHVPKEQAFKKAIELNPNNDSAYTVLGGFYRDYGKFVESEQAFKKAIELNPNNDSAYTQLGWVYKNQGKFVESEQAFKKAIELNPNNDSAYTVLGWLYRDQERFTESEQLLKKAIGLNPKSNFAYMQLSGLYKNQGRFTELVQLLKKAVEVNPESYSAYGGLAIIYHEMGNNGFSKIYAEKANSLKDKYYNSITINNYHILEQILYKRKISLVCVEYPVRNIVPLKNIFKEEMEDSIIFVDNEKIFKDAVRKEGYKEYFRDMLGGNFGHCTEKGNRLLAENIANAILKEVFGK